MATVRVTGDDPMLAAAHMAAEAAGAAVTRGPGGGAAIEVDGAATEGARAAFEKAAALDASGNALGLNDAAQGAAAEWVDFAFSQWVTGDAAALFQAKKETLGSLQSIGVRSSDLQIRVLDACMDAGLRAALQRLESALLRTRFLSGGATLGAADFAVAAALADYFGTLLDDSARVAFPAVTRWFVAVSETRAFRAALPAFRIHLRRREGGQIDLRPDPVRAAALADGSIAKNASAKKQASQRQREKAAREEAAQPAQPAKAAGAAAAAAAGDEPEVKSAIAVTARVSRPTHEAFATPVGTADSEEAEEVAIAELERRLAALGISFTTVRHEKVMTVEEQAQHVSALGLEGALTKNLFLKGKKPRETGDSRLWLLVCTDDRKLDMKALAKGMGYKQGLRFGDDATMKKTLGVVQGAVSAFALGNDASAHSVRLAIDKALLAADKINFHPLSNRATTTINAQDLLRFVEATGHAYEIVDLDSL